MQAVDIFSKGHYYESYLIIKSMETEEFTSFAEQFFIGKVFSLSENKDYKRYFNKAKNIDKARYRKELSDFLKFKEDVS